MGGRVLSAWCADVLPSKPIWKSAFVSVYVNDASTQAYTWRSCFGSSPHRIVCVLVWSHC